MGLPQNIALPAADRVNESIWRYLHDGDLTPLSTLDRTRLGIPTIEEEIKTGCSPCPDTLTEGFGTDPSVMFLSTVYGPIHNRLCTEFDRSSTPWQKFVRVFYKKVIRQGKGIYGRLARLYDLACEVSGLELDFCFTELVKTVLVGPDGEVTGLDAYWPRYFEAHEQHFLRERLMGITGKCVIFAFSEMSTFVALAMLGGEKELFAVQTLPARVEVLFPVEPPNDVAFSSRINRAGNPGVQVRRPGPNSTYTRTIARRTIFGVEDRDIWIVPLPHPSPANGRCWRESIWPELERLLCVVQTLPCSKVRCTGAGATHLRPFQ